MEVENLTNRNIRLSRTLVLKEREGTGAPCAVVYPLGKAAIQHKSEEYSQRIANQIGRHSPAWDAGMHTQSTFSMSSTIVVDAGGESAKIQNDEGEKKKKKNPLNILENIEQQRAPHAVLFLY